jgi:outer membrane protein TolC
MVRYVGMIAFILLAYSAEAQRRISRDDAVNMAVANQRNLQAARLSVQQQQQLLSGASGLSSPQVFGEVTPYEPLLIGIQQTFSLPVVYRRNIGLQREMLRLAQLQLQGTEYELKREVRLSYLQLQYLNERRSVLKYQDSIYQAIKTSSERFFEAGQINKLEELQSTTQADAVRNQFDRLQSELEATKQIFTFLTGYADTFTVSDMEAEAFIPSTDTAVNNIQQQILQQQVNIGASQLRVTKASLLPQIQAGASFPTTKEFERAVGVQFGITIPIWRKQNRSQVAAAQTAIEVAQAQQQLARQRLSADYRQAMTNYQRELGSINYYNATALPQARSIIETSSRFFQAGELTYIESLRNLQTAFDIFFNHLETLKAYNEAVIQLNYLNGTL